MQIDGNKSYDGLPHRLRLAAQIMPGIIAAPAIGWEDHEPSPVIVAGEDGTAWNSGRDPDRIALMAVRAADALIEAHNRTAEK